MTRRIPLIFMILLIALPTVLSGCSSGDQTSASSTEIKMAHLSDMPAEVQAAPISVQDAYRFNVANPDLMQQIPCYCGCGNVGHTSNYSCYVKEDNNGEISFDGHALGCSICVDITADSMRMLKDGKSTAEIKQAIDDTYGKFGPSNIN